MKDQEEGAPGSVTWCSQPQSSRHGLESVLVCVPVWWAEGGHLILSWLSWNKAGGGLFFMG